MVDITKTRLDTNEIPSPKKSILKIVAIIASILLVLFVCILTFVFVIPRTNIFKFGDTAIERIENEINEID